jgi:hypothetical protein
MTPFLSAHDTTVTMTHLWELQKLPVFFVGRDWNEEFNIALARKTKREEEERNRREAIPSSGKLIISKQVPGNGINV